MTDVHVSPDKDDSRMANAPSKLILIAALTRTNGLGVKGTLPWRLPKEMAHFRQATSYVPSCEQMKLTNAVVMGRKTWQSIPPKFRPLKGRINVVVSRQSGTDVEQALGIDQAEDTHLVSSLDAAVTLLRSHVFSVRLHRTFLIGGAQLYAQAMQAHRSSDTPWILDTLLITRIHEPAYDECDVFLPEYRSARQIEEEQVGDSVVSSDDSDAVYTRVSADHFDAFMDERVARGTVEEKGSQYTLQMWKRVGQ